MAVGYRMVLNVSPKEDVLALAQDVVREWVVSKLRKQGSNAVRASQGLSFDRSFRQQFSPRLTGVNTIVNDGEGRTRQLFRLEEQTSPGQIWAVSVAATRVETPGRRFQSITVEVDPQQQDREAAVMNAGIPQFVRPLLEDSRRRFWSGSTPVTGLPQILRGTQGAVSTKKAILDPERLVSVVVAAPVPGVSPESWAPAIKGLTVDSVGVSTAVVLDDAALAQLNRLLPDWLGLEPGEVRTYAPHVDIDDENDGLRHRRLGPATFQRHLSTHPRTGALQVDTVFSRAHARRARQTLLDQPTDEGIRSLGRLLRSEELKVQRETAPERSSTALTLQRSQSPTARRRSPASRPGGAPVAGSAKTSRSTARPKPTAPARPIEHTPKAPSPLPAPSSLPDTTPAPTATLEKTPWLKDLGGLLSELMGEATVDETSIELLIDHVRTSAQRIDSLEAQIDDAVASQDSLERALEEEQARSSYAELELEVLEDERAAAVREAERLRQRIIDAEDWDAFTHLDDADPWDSVPETMEELTQRIDGSTSAVTSRIVFCGDLETAVRVDSLRDGSRLTKTLWDCLRALDGYLTAVDGGFAGGVHRYLKSTETPGHRCPPRRHAATESESVRQNRSWRDERLLPVPTEVDPSGRVHMFAHFKTSGAGGVAPRMHYLDDTANTGKIYVGYIGYHLTNTQTS